MHQLQQYYRLGVLDNCYGKWGALMDCLTLKTKASSQVQEILDAREKAKIHICKVNEKEAAIASLEKEFESKLSSEQSERMKQLNKAKEEQKPIIK